MTDHLTVMLNKHEIAQELENLSQFYGDRIAAVDFMIRKREIFILENRNFDIEELLVAKELKAEIAFLKTIDTPDKINSFLLENLNSNEKPMALSGKIEIEIGGYSLTAKYTYFPEYDDFTLLRGTYRNDTGEELPMIYVDMVSECHRQTILAAIKQSLQRTQAA